MPVFLKEAAGDLAFDWGAIDASAPLRTTLDEVGKAAERKNVMEQAVTEKNRAFAFNVAKAEADDALKVLAFNEQVRGNISQEQANSIAQKDRNAIAVMARENQQQVTLNRTEALSIKAEEEARKAAKDKQNLITQEAGILLAKKTNDFKGKTESEVNAEVIRLAGTGNPRDTIVAESLLDSVNTIRRGKVDQTISDYNKTITKLADPNVSPADKLTLFQETGLNIRPELSLETKDSDLSSIKKEYTKARMGYKDDKGKEVLKEFNSDLLGKKSISADSFIKINRGLGYSDAHIANRMREKTLDFYNKRVDRATGTKKVELQNLLAQYTFLTEPGTKSAAVKKKIKEVEAAFSKYVKQ